MNSLSTAFFNRLARHQVQKLDALDLYQSQLQVFHHLLRNAAGSQFYREHDLHPEMSLDDYRQAVPLMHYDDYRQRYLEPHLENLQGLLCTRPVPLLVRTSGSSSGREKYLPVNRPYLNSHRKASLLQAQFNYLRLQDPAALFRPVFWLTDLSDLHPHGPYQAATLSRLMREVLPPWLNRNIFPAPAVFKEIPVAERFQRVMEMATERNFIFISGMTPWLMTLFEAALAYSGKANLKELWPDLRMVSHAGVDFSLHRAKMQQLAGPGVEFVASYVSTEGFIAFQGLSETGLRILPQHGLFYEFVRQDEAHTAHPKRYGLWEVESDVNYILYISNLCGLWSLELGDVVRFSQLQPYPLLQVTGRVHEKFDFFGEKVLLDEIRAALLDCNQKHHCQLNHFHIGPDFVHRGMLLLLDFAAPPSDLQAYLSDFDRALQPRNDQYHRNRQSGVNAAPRAQLTRPGAFQLWLQQQAGGQQSKVPHFYANPDDFKTLLETFQRQNWLESTA